MRANTQDELNHLHRVELKAALTAVTVLLSRSRALTALDFLGQILKLTATTCTSQIRTRGACETLAR